METTKTKAVNRKRGKSQAPVTSQGQRREKKRRHSGDGRGGLIGRNIKLWESYNVIRYQSDLRGNDV